MFERMCDERGVPRWLARSYYLGLQMFGKRATTRKQIRRLMTAP